MTHFIPLASDSEQTDVEGTNKVKKGRVEVVDNDVDFPLIHLGVSTDTSRETWGYVREYAALTPSEARKIARALNKAARVATDYIRETGWVDGADDDE